jgi:hypothetical protein
MYPWRDGKPESPNGLNEVPHSNTIRIVSVELPVPNYSRWFHWSSQDGTTWVDFVEFPSRQAAAELLQSARQRHTGYRDADQLLLFTNLCDSTKDAIGTALIGPSGQLLNVGMKLSIAVCPAAMAESELKTLDDAISRLQMTLRSLAVRVLDPAYVTFDPKISAKPDAIRLLRMAAFARLCSEVKYNFVYLEQRSEVDWEGVLERYMPRIAAANDDVEYGRILEEVVALLKDGHTSAYPKAVAPVDGPLVNLEPIQGKPVVTAVGNLPELAPIKPGMELIEIDHAPVATIIRRDIDPYIASSTAQDRALREMRMLLKGPPDGAIQTKWVDLQGKTLEVVLHRNASKNRSAMPTKQRERFEYTELPGHISYMALNDFGDEGWSGISNRNFNRPAKPRHGSWIFATMAGATARLGTKSWVTSLPQQRKEKLGAPVFTTLPCGRGDNLRVGMKEAQTQSNLPMGHAMPVPSTSSRVRALAAPPRIS